MAEEKGAGFQDALAVAPIMVQTENSSFNIGMLLDEKNYDLWAPLIQIHIAGRQKMGYLRGLIKAPHEDEIWDSFKTAYFDENGEARIYLLNQKALPLRQNSRPLATYFGELTEIFQELDHFNRVSMECENDIKIFQKSTERQRVYIFLAGLDDRKEAMKMEVDKSESAAMAAKTRGSSPGLNREGSQNRPGQTQPSQPSWDRPQGKCPHCGLPGHSKSCCFELIGYPEN
ncbi:hypothetical protein POTOM_052779 [Populus tomentosa]|uniref:Retrotransposon Copia-like N-terminal domain-containing protein n=1 Tax=Populus tomentosa TaxID=118781 RepID=A0A8X7YES6_POPTO|nr:hypothetical protein POTOM_052779 [Populus tomentosa]